MPYNEGLMAQIEKLGEPKMNDTVRNEIANWWKERYARQKVFDNFTLYEENFHYKGNPPWPDLVSLSALDEEFRRYVYGRYNKQTVGISKISFATEFKKVAAVSEVKRKRVPVFIGDNSKPVYHKVETYYNMRRLGVPIV